MGGTPSAGTGPDTGDDGVANRYYYAEASAPRATGDVFELHYDGSACGGSSIVRELSFAYHMYGATMGSLRVHASNGQQPSDQPPSLLPSFLHLLRPSPPCCPPPITSLLPFAADLRVHTIIFQDQ